MITLRTGLPGNAKTLFALADLINFQDENEKNGLHRKVYYFNIELNLDHPLYDKVKDWIKVEAHDLTINLPSLYDDQHPTIEQGSIILIDECQDLYPTRHKGEVPEFLKFFEKHRHTGCDFWLITQQTRQIDIHLRELVGEHYHFHRILGRQASKVKFLTKVMDDKNSDSVEIQTSVRKFPGELFGLYKSAVIHTHKRKLPWKLTFGLPLILIFISLMVFWVYHTLFSGEKTNPNTQPISTHVGSSSPPSDVATKHDYKIYLSSLLQINGQILPVFLYLQTDGSEITLFLKDLQKLGAVKQLRPGLYTFDGSVVPNLPKGVHKNEKNSSLLGSD